MVGSFLHVRKELHEGYESESFSMKCVKNLVENIFKLWYPFVEVR